MQLQKHIPNLLTSLNLLSGSIAIVFAFEGLFHFTAIFIGIAAFFDFCDGMSARLLDAYSPIGKELDSLADMVSFGFTPAVVLFKLLQQAGGALELPLWGINILPFVAFLITIFSALRLAIFNIDSRQSESFIGLPTPANAIFIISMPFALHYGSGTSPWYPFFAFLLANPFSLLALILLFSYLLVAPMPLFSLKVKSFDFSQNLMRYIFLLGALLLILLFGWFAIPLTIIYYIILSLAQHLGNRHITRT